ncbi:MAG TPA: response regulator transcription factor [Candidatus Limnocylindrales bacterium]
MPTDRPLRIVIAEDSVLLREGLTGILHRFGHTVIAEVGEARALLAAVEADRPDIVIADVRMPPSHTDEGMRAALTLRASHPGLAILVLSQYIEQTYATELLDTGQGSGVGYLLKDRVGKVAEFIDALQRVAAGGTVIDSDVVRQLLTLQRGPLNRLTAREQEVIALMAQGLSNTAIARAMVVTEAAVAKHIARILTKLDLPPDDNHNRRVLAVLAFLRNKSSLAGA